MERLDSIKNPLIQRLRSLKTAEGREAERLFLVEGEKLLRENLNLNIYNTTCPLIWRAGKYFFSAGIFVVLVVAHQRLVNVEVVEELKRHPGVLGGYEIGGAQGLGGSGRKVSQIADGRANKI